ncbi:MAG: DUF2249 domain-containing protein [Trebonia sp.]|uniref:DUF2249 domain-containing protein n=1 Tax=Trebonia sp. TaxID=2767075 RepID=UPI003BAF23E7
MTDHELDVRPLPRPGKHPAIFLAYGALGVGESIAVVNDHDPRHLRDEFEVEHPGGYAWEYLARERGAYRIRITKLAATPLPRVLADAAAVSASSGDATGAVWKLQMRERDLDSNIIALPPGAAIGAHTGPDVDVLIYVLAGSGQLGTELDAQPVALRGGSLIWLPRRSRRQFTAGPDGLRYLTVHQRRQALTLTTAPA